MVGMEVSGDQVLDGLKGDARFGQPDSRRADAVDQERAITAHQRHVRILMQGIGDGAGSAQQDQTQHLSLLSTPAPPPAV